MAKKQYRVRNWGDYNKALVKRGSITLWFDNDTLSHWHAAEQTGQRGRPYRYADVAIECGLSLRALFHLSLRATQGFIESLSELLQVTLEVPDYTTLCRRQRHLRLSRFHQTESNQPLHVLIDSSGIKVYGEGEWKVKMHGKSKRRTWRKLHIALDAATQNIVAHEVTLASVHDTVVLPSLMDKIKQAISRVSADGLYDTQGCYDAITQRKAIPNLPPRKNAVLSSDTDLAHQWRNYNVTATQQLCLATWKQHTHYHRRSLVETAFFRLKTLFGHTAKNRCFQHQITELALRCNILNRFNQLGLPISIPI